MIRLPSGAKLETDALSTIALLEQELSFTNPPTGTEIGQARRIDTAIELARNSDIDFAVLDVNVGGSKSFPVADILRQRGIPFAFASGYGAEGLMDGYRDSPALRKPYGQKDLERTIAQALRS